MESLTTYLDPEFDERGRLLIHGFDLRYAMTAMLAAEHEAMSIRQLQDRLGAGGYAVRGRPSKTMSDALRAEIGKGRVIRVSRGWYRLDVVTKTTRWRIRHHVARLETIRQLGPAPGSGGADGSALRRQFVGESRSDGAGIEQAA